MAGEVYEDDKKIPKKKFKEFDDIKSQAILAIILDSNFGNVTDFKEELLENNMILSFNYNASFFDDYLIITFTFESKVFDAVIQKIEESLKNLVVTERDLKREVKCAVANFILKYDDMEMVSNDIQNDLIMYGQIHDDVISMYKKITLLDINKIIKLINIDNVSITKVLPIEK